MNALQRHNLDNLIEHYLERFEDDPVLCFAAIQLCSLIRDEWSSGEIATAQYETLAPIAQNLESGIDDLNHAS